MPYDASVAERLERLIGSRRIEVLRLGMSGAPLSQYLHMLRREGVDYRPDLVIQNLVHNDFDQSFKSLGDALNSNTTATGTPTPTARSLGPLNRAWKG